MTKLTHLHMFLSIDGMHGRIWTDGQMKYRRVGGEGEWSSLSNNDFGPWSPGSFKRLLDSVWWLNEQPAEYTLTLEAARKSGRPYKRLSWHKSDGQPLYAVDLVDHHGTPCFKFEDGGLSGIHLHDMTASDYGVKPEHQSRTTITESSGNFLLRAGVNAHIWAEEFCKITGFPDEELAYGWFANAIHAGMVPKASTAVAEAPTTWLNLHVGDKVNVSLKPGNYTGAVGKTGQGIITYVERGGTGVSIWTHLDMFTEEDK